MINRKSISTELERSTRNLIRILDGIKPDQFDIKPDISEWSIAQICEHLIRMENFIDQSMRLATRPLTTRKYGEKAKYIRESLFDFNNKFTTEERFQPSNKIRKKQEIISELKKVRKSLQEFIRSNELSVICMGCDHPLYGTLTRAEWIYFIIYHSERHLIKISRIAKDLNDKIME